MSHIAMPTPHPRHHVFATALARADWTSRQMWVSYFAMGGSRDAFDIDAYVYGLGALTEDQQDILACAVNERLDDLYRAACVPYLATLTPESSQSKDLTAILEELVGGSSHDENSRQ